MLLKCLNTLAESLIVLMLSIFFLFQLNTASGSVRFIPAGHLAKGMRLLTNDGQIITIQSIEQKDKQAVMYNLTVNNQHNYFINNQSQNGGILVHNMCEDGSEHITAEEDRMTQRPQPPSNLSKQGPMNYSETEYLKNKPYMNQKELIVYRSDNRSPQEIYDVGGFHPRELDFNGVSTHNAGITDHAVSTSEGIKTQFGTYTYRIRLRSEQGIDVASLIKGNPEHGVLLENEQEILVPGHISLEQIEYADPDVLYMGDYSKFVWVPIGKKLTYIGDLL